MTKTFCDMCGQETRPVFTVSIESSHYSLYAAEVCKNCANKVRDFIEAIAKTIEDQGRKANEHNN